MRSLSFFILFCWTSTQLLAQPPETTSGNFLTRIQTSIEVGYMLTSTTFQEDADIQNGTANYFYGYLGVHAYYSLVEAGDHVSVGFQPGLQVGYDITSRNNRDWMTNIPLIFMAKFGTNASRFSNWKVGLAVGAGGDLLFQHINSAGNGLNRVSNTWESVDYSGWGFVPATVGELTLGKRNVMLFGKRRQHMFFTIRLSAHPFRGPAFGAASFKNSGNWYKDKGANYGKYALSVVYNF